MNELKLYTQRFEGNGKIIYSHANNDISFEINCSPFHIELKTSRVIFGQLYSINTGRFKGITSDGIRIYCENICLVEYDKYRLTFTLLSPLIVGEINKPIVFKAKLFGLGNDQLNFKYKDKSISFEKADESDKVAKLARNFGYQIENGSILIQGDNEEILDIEDTIKLAKRICLLLSFVLGKNVTFNNCEFINEQKESVEFYEITLVNNSKGTRFILEKNISKYLPKMIEEFDNLEEKDFKCFQTTINYLNSTSNKYLEDSILAMAQIWEILADNFLESKVENNPQVTELRTILKREIRSWHKSNEIKNYDLGFIMERVLTSLDWEKVITKLKLLAIQENLDTELIGIDFNKLIKIRNQIAHTGRFTELGNEYEYLEIYNRAKLGIHALLLNKLGYNGTLIENIGGIPKINRIDNLLKK